MGITPGVDEMEEHLAEIEAMNEVDDIIECVEGSLTALVASLDEVNEEQQTPSTAHAGGGGDHEHVVPPLRWGDEHHHHHHPHLQAHRDVRSPVFGTRLSDQFRTSPTVSPSGDLSGVPILPAY